MGVIAGVGVRAGCLGLSASWGRLRWAVSCGALRR